MFDFGNPGSGEFSAEDVALAAKAIEFIRAKYPKARGPENMGDGPYGIMLYAKTESDDPRIKGMEDASLVQRAVRTVGFDSPEDAREFIGLIMPIYRPRVQRAMEGALELARKLGVADVKITTTLSVVKVTGVDGFDVHVVGPGDEEKPAFDSL